MQLLLQFAGVPDQTDKPSDTILSSALKFIGPGGADAVGPGPVDVRGFVRVVDGDTLDVMIRGHRVAVGLLGVHAPLYNTQCGAQATAALMALARGGIHFDDDPTVTFDSRLRRMYRAVALDGTDVAEQLARTGMAVGDGRGQRAANVFLAENEARLANRGCAWRSVPPPQQLPNGRVARAEGTDVGDLARGIGNAIGAVASSLSPSVALAAPLTTTFPAGFTQDVIAAGLNQPTAMAFLPDGRILVATKTGVVRIIKNGSLLPAPFIDMTSRVNSYFDHGLLGIAADPNFATNGYVYLLYTYEDNALASTGPKAGRFSRVTAIGDSASPASEVALLGTVVGGSCNDHPVGADCIPTDNLSHAQGNIKFAADGSIFLTLGDGASFSTVDPMALRAQDLNSFSGKIVHILPSGLAAPENPFHTGDPTALRSKIWAYGLRNAYRFNIRPSNGRVYIGDVGWNDLEEINVVPPGVNLGWPCYEGPQIQVGYQSYPVCQALYAAGTARNPLVAYTHGGGSTAVTGGAFYTGTVYPAQYQGAYFYADYGQSYMRTLRVDANDNLLSGPTDFATSLDGPVDVEIGPDQNIYYLAINTSELRRIRFTGNAPPNAVASVSPNNGVAPLTVQFSSAGSNDPEGEALSYSWNFGDGTAVSTAANPSHTYTTNGTRTATLTVSDPNGSGTATVQVIVGNVAPTATIVAPTSAFTYGVGDVINFSGSANDPETGAVSGSNLSWQVIVHHCPGGNCHTHFLLSAVGASGQFTAPDHGDDSYFEIQLTATDPAGLTGTASVSIHPRTSQLTIAASTAGMQVILDGATSVAPLVHNSVVGSSHAIDTPSPQGNNTFASWSDGGAQHHNIVVGASNATYTAIFNLATNTSLALDGGTGYARAPHDPKLNTLGDWTVEAWFKDESPSGYNHDRSFIVIKGATDLDGEANYLMYMEWNTLVAGVRTNWTNQVVTASLLGTTFNAWHHAAASLVASTRVLTLYLDGVQVAQTTIPALSPTGSSYGIFVGRNGSAGGGWRGKIDDVRVWNVARTGTQIASSFRSELSGTPGGLVGNWKFDEGSGTIAADTTPNPMNATLFGAATWSADVGNGPPPPPPPTAISSLTATNITNGSAQISWTTNNQADTQVDYGTTTSYGSSTTLDAALATTHSQQVTGLVASTLYHYRARSRDAGGTLVLSADQSFTTAAPPPPTQISGVAPGIVTNTSAQIGWTTNNPADSQIDYGTTTAYGSTSALDPAMVTAHSQTLSGLSSNTTYHYRARSRDAGGTLVTSGDFTFTTTNAPPAFSLALSGAGYAEAPLAPKLNLTGDWTVETWFKDEDPSGYNHDFSYLLLKGNTDIDSESPYVLGVQYGNLFAGVRTGWTNQVLNVSLLTTTANRWHHVASTFVAATRTVTIYLDGIQVAQGVLPARTTTGNARPLEIGRNGNGAGTFRGKVDDLRIWNVVRTAAEIQSSYATELASAPAALVGNWKFDEGAGANATDSAAGPVTAILVGGATWSTDVGNGPPPPPPPTTISAVASTNVTNGSAQITWTTNNPANSQVDYGTTTSYGLSTTLDAARVTSHAQQITGLAASTLYHFHVRSTDANGTTVTSGDFTFTTAAPPPPTSISAVASTGVTNSAATITWTTNNPADSQINYGTTASYGFASTLDPALVTSHSQTLGGLTPATTYHYQVRSRDAGGTVVTSGDFTFTTTNAAPARSLALSGTAYAEAPNATELNITGDWTLEAWIKDESVGGYNHDFTYILLKGNTDASGEAPYMLGVAWNTLFAGERAGWANYTLSAPIGGLTSGAWHHVAATMVASTRVLTLYVDGAQAAQGTLAAQSSTGNGLPIEIGRNGSGAGLWRGKLDDVRIWNVVRTSAQIAANYASELSSPPTGLVGSWQFNEGVGTIAADATATPENAALLAGATWSTDVGNGPPPPPPPTQITAVTATNITNGSALITWTTNNPASSRVEYGTTTGYGSATTLDQALITSHAQQISSLSASTLYHYRVISTDAAAITVTSADAVFTTAAPPPPTTITGVSSSSITNVSAVVSWSTNNSADTQIDYGTSTSYGATSSLDTTLVTSHSQQLTGLAPSTTYHYRARSRDAGGTLVLSGDFTFTTTNTAPASSLMLNGGYAEAPNATELNITGDWTLETWFKDESVGGYNHDVTYILLKGNTDAMSDAPYIFGVGWNGLFAGGRVGWTNYTFAASLGATTTGAWHHGAATFVASTRTLTLYLDGVQVGQAALAARTTTGNGAPIEIGRNGNGAGAWRGKLDDVRIWNVARTAAQIAANYQTAFSSAPAGLVANWQFDEGSGATSADRTATPENAGLFAGAGWSTDVHP